MKKCLLLCVSILITLSSCGSSGGGGGGIMTLVIDPVDGGTHEISGTITLPDTVVSGKTIYFQTNRITGGAYVDLDGLNTTNGENQIKFRIINLADGDFKFRMVVDNNNDINLGNKGDFDGYYDGTVAAPITSIGAAATVTVSGADVPGCDFGIAEVPYSHTITIDGTNDFTAGKEDFATSTGTGTIYVSYDAANLYIGMADASIEAAGAGNKFLYFIFTTDGAFATGLDTSSDNKAVFGTGGDKMQWHWKERVDGASYSEFREADGIDWATDWASGSESVSRAEDFVEALIPLSNFGSPSSLFITVYLIDYDGDGGNGWLYNMLSGATDGSGAVPRDLVEYVEISLQSSADPNDAGNIKTFD